MRLFLILAVLVACATVGYSKEQYTSTAVAAVDPARATAKTLSLVSSIKGKKFDRFVSIWLENQNYTIAADDRMPPPIQNYPLIYIRSFTPIDRQPRKHPDQLQSHNLSKSVCDDSTPPRGADWEPPAFFESLESQD